MSMDDNFADADADGVDHLFDDIEEEILKDASFFREPPPPELDARDRLWCEAILSVLDTREVEKVTRAFNEMRRNRGIL